MGFGKHFRILLCIPPAYEREFPPLGTPAVVAFLKSKGVLAFQQDLNIKFFEYVRRNKLTFKFTKRYKNSKIKRRVYYWQSLKYSNRDDIHYLFEKVPGAAFDFTESLLSSQNLLRYIDDEKENIFHKFFKNEILPRIKKEGFSMVGFSITAPSQVISTFTFGRIIKSELPDMHIVIGGQWVSFFREELIKRGDFSAFYDYIIYFEGESPLYALIDSIRKNKPLSFVPNLIYKRKGKFILSKKVSDEDMDELPCLDFDGLPLKKYSSSMNGKTCSLTFETSRGCYWNRCIFCVDLPFPKPRYREKDISLIIDDIKTLKRKYKVKELMISNAVFSPWQMEKFCKELIKNRIKIKWWAMARFEKEFSKELLMLVKKAGCTKLGFGLESMSQRVLDFCDKGTSTGVIKSIVEDARDVKLNIYYQVMIGMPSETTKDALNTISFLLGYHRKTVFNIYYLIPKNFVFNNPEKYGIDFKDNSNLPFRFFYPFRHTLGNIDIDRARKIIEFYKHARTQNSSQKRIEGKRIIRYCEQYLLGSMYEEQKRPDMAIEIFTALSKIFPKASFLYLTLCRSYFSLKKYDKAIKAAYKVMELNGKVDNIHLLLGFCYKELKQNKVAIEELRKAKRINPEVPEINFYLSDCYRNIGQIQEANKEMDKGILKLNSTGDYSVSLPF